MGASSPYESSATRDRKIRNSLLIAYVLLILSTVPSRAGSFDGSWSVLQVCDTTSEGARGYTWRYDATVKDGHLVGQYGTRGQNSSLSLEGQVQQDGSAILIGTGISGDANYNIKFAPSQSRINFRVVAKFGASTGNGRRVGDRKCAFSFQRH
jgi:hypothetical protein